MPEAMVDPVGIRLVKIPAGHGVLGSPSMERDRDSDEGPQVQIEMSSFWCAAHPVTQQQYAKVTATAFTGDPMLPVTMISCADAVEFTRCLSELTGDMYPLSTEAQWEYACRAGTNTAYCFGDDVDRPGEFAWFAANSNDCVHAVGLKLPNARGLFDMHGNLREWCPDLWSALGHDPAATPDQVASRGFTRNIRGGCFYSDAQAVRSAKRFGCNATNRFESVGFRVIRRA